MDARKAEDSAARAAQSADSAKSSSDQAEQRLASDHDRQFQRARTLLSGILFSDGARVAVLVLDLSANGARVRVKGEVPDALAFRIQVNTVGLFRALLRWRDGDTLGIRFTEKPEFVVRNLAGRLKNVLAKGYVTTAQS